MSPIQLAELARIAEWLREECADDERAYEDSLEGCTSFMEALELTHKEHQRDDELITGIKARMNELNARLHRIEARKDAKRKAMGQILRAAGLKKAELVEATVSVRDGKPKLVINDPAAVPEQYTRTKIEPDKTAINKAFEDAETLPNWLSSETQGVIVTIRKA